MDNCHLFVANFRGSRLLTIRVNGQITAAAASVVPYQRSGDDLANRMEQLRQDVCLDDFRVCAVKVINELKQIEKKLKNQEIGINVAKTIITGQGVSGAALCLTPWAPVAVAGIAGIATTTTFCVDMYLNAKRARESKRILERDEFMKKMQKVMEKLGITDQDLLIARTDAESNKWMFDEDIDGVLQKIFKFITDY